MAIVTPRIDQVCGRLFKYYQNFRVEGHSLLGVGTSVGKEAMEVHGAYPEVRWVSDEVAPGYYKSVRVDNELYQVGPLSGNLCICSHDYRLKTLSLLSLKGAMIELGLPLSARV